MEASHGCWGRPSTTVVRSSEARVFSKRVYLTSRETDGAAGYRLVDYGCHYGKRATYRLPQQGEFGITAIPRAPLALSGRFVGYVQRFSSAAGGDNVEVTVRNLVTGRVLHGFSGSESNFDSSFPVFDLVVKRNGSAAWISEDRSNPDGSPRETENQVHVADVSGQRRIVDRGAGIEPRSLELTPDCRAIVYTKDAERRTVPLD
ncbi:MAG: hypothetical protein ACR2NV_03115 [Thermoleophilaceae bacterium]